MDSHVFHVLGECVKINQIVLSLLSYGVSLENCLNAVKCCHLWTCNCTVYWLMFVISPLLLKLSVIICKTFFLCMTNSLVDNSFESYSENQRHLESVNLN